MKKKIKILLAKYYEGGTNHEEELELVNYFSSEKIDEEFMLHQQEFLMLHSFKNIVMSESETKRIENYFKSNESRQYFWKNFGKIAASILLAFSGYFIGNVFPINNNSETLSELKKDLESVNENTALLLLNQPLANERLRGLEYIGKLEKIEKEIVNSLLISLNTDSNENVRLASIPYLLKYPNKTLIKNELIKSVNLQESPLIQLEIINTLIYLLDETELENINTQIHLRNPNKLVTKRLESI